MKDALGHGSSAHGAGIAAAVPAKGAPNNVIPDKAWRQVMPKGNYMGQVQDMLGMWSGSQKPEALTPAESKQVSDAWDAGHRDWRGLAGNLQSQRSVKP